MGELVKVAIIGHSNIPVEFTYPGTEVRCFRMPGLHVLDISRRGEYRELLAWRCQLVYLWAGSNDLANGMVARPIARKILNTATQIRHRTGARVIIIKIEPRYCKPGYVASQTVYNTLARQINRHLDNWSRPGQIFLQLNGAPRHMLDHTGYHFNAEGKAFVNGLIANSIRQYMESRGLVRREEEEAQAQGH